MSINETFSHEEIMAMKQSGQVVAKSGKRLDSPTVTPANEQGGLKISNANAGLSGNPTWGSAPRVGEMEKVEKPFVNVPKVTRPSARVVESFNRQDRELAAKKLAEMEAAEEKVAHQQFVDELPEYAKRMDAVISRMDKKIKKLEAQLKHMGEGTNCD